MALTKEEMEAQKQLENSVPNAAAEDERDPKGGDFKGKLTTKADVVSGEINKRRFLRNI